PWAARSSVPPASLRFFPPLLAPGFADIDLPGSIDHPFQPRHQPSPPCRPGSAQPRFSRDTIPMDAFPDHLFSRMLFKAGEVIFDEGQRGDCAYLIDAGEVAILKRRAQGYRPLARIGQGSIFGEMALIDDQPRMAQAKALVDTNCVIITRERVRAK